MPDLSISSLLSKILLSFTLEFERGSDLSLALGANLLRVLDDRGTRVRDLPALTGVAKMGVANSLSILEKRRYVVVAPDPTGSRAKLVSLTARGREAQDAYHRLVRELELLWVTRLGEPVVCALRESLVDPVGDGTAHESPLVQGLEPYPDCWRSEVPKPEVLPHYPMVSHRGGFPDGS